MPERTIQPPPPPPPPDEVAVPASNAPAVMIVTGQGPKPIQADPPTTASVPAASKPPQPAPVAPPPQPTSQSPVPVPAEPAIEPESTEPAEPTTPPLNVPPAFVEFLFSTFYSASVKAVQDEFKLSDDDTVFVGDLDRMVMAGEIDAEVYAAALEDEFKAKMGEDGFTRFLSRLVADRLLPLGDDLKPSAQEVARMHGLAIPQGPHYRVYSKPLTYSGAATEIAATAGFSIMGGPVRERLRELVMSKSKGVRTDTEVRETLTRGIDFGGIGLDPKSAERAIAAMNDILGRARVMSEDEYASWLSAEARRKAEQTSNVQRPTSLGGTQDAGRRTTDDEDEIARMQSTMQRPAIDTSSELAKAVAATLQRLTYKPTDDYLAKRLQNVLSSRLRDVRSSIEFRQMLLRPVKVGGLGLEAEAADEVAKQIEQSYKEFHDAIATEEKGKIEQQLEEQTRKVEERRHREAEEHAKWFEEKIRSRKGGTEQEQGEEAMRKLMGGMQSKTPMEAKEARVEAEKFGTLVPTAATGPVGAGLGLPKGGVNPAPTPTPSGPKVAEVTKPGIRVSPSTVEIAKATAAVRPTLDAVKYAGPALVGLVGELTSLSTSEFRRLSKDPQQAAQKVIQKVETLGQESFEKRVAGIKAFQGSPLQAAYMALVAESFKTAKPVAALADEKRKAGQDTLSPDEIAAVMKLNSALHF